ncbi:hypothetical protein RUND412_002827 [Rhizina undulata]
MAESSSKPALADSNSLQAEDTDSIDKRVYPSTTKVTFITIGLCLATLLVALDNTIVATAIPVITSQFESLADVGWYGSAYLLTTTALQPSFGKIYKFFNMKWTYIFGVFIFELGSLICAVAPNSDTFIVGRAIAGIGSAAIFQGSLTIVAFIVPLEKRTVFIALVSSMFAISSCVGPVLGGVLTDGPGWRWCFWINLPIGFVTIVIVTLLFTPPVRPNEINFTLKEKLKRIDYIGAFFLISAITCLLLTLQWGGNYYAWNSPRIIGLLVAFGILILIFVGLQKWVGEEATIPAHVFLKQRTVFFSSWYSFLFSMALYTHQYYMPIYFQAVRGNSAMTSGIKSIPYLLGIPVAAMFTGILVTFVGYYVPFLIAGSVVFTIGCGMLYTIAIDSPPKIWIGYQLLCGLGSGFGVQIPFTAVQTVLSEEDLPIGNALAVFFSQLGGTLTISIGQSILTNTLTREVLRQTTINPQDLILWGATGFRRYVTDPVQLQGVLRSYMAAIKETFILPIVVTAISLFIGALVEWRSVKAPAKKETSVEEAEGIEL